MFEFHRMKRLPPYVFSVVDQLKMEARHRGEDIIDFGMGNPDQPPPPRVISKLIESVRKSHNHRYSVSRGITNLRRAMADRYQRVYGIELDPESEVIATIGSKALPLLCSYSSLLVYWLSCGFLHRSLA